MNVLIVGYGSIAEKHLNGLRALNLNLKVWALRNSRDAEIIRNVTNIYRYEDIPKQIDFAIISNPTSKHLDAIQNLISLNIPLFIEKPITHTLDHLDRISSLIRSKNIISYVGCVLRFHPCLKYVKEHLQQNNDRINEVNIYCGSYLPDWRPDSDYKNIYSSKIIDGGGVHLDLFHEIDYTLWLFGLPLDSSKVLESKSSLEIESVDSANYIFKYKDFNVNMTLNYFRKIPKRKIEIVFENNIWEIDLIKGTIIENDSSELFESELSIIDLYKIQLKYFIEHIHQQKDTENNFEASAQILKYCLKNE